MTHQPGFLDDTKLFDVAAIGETVVAVGAHRDNPRTSTRSTPAVFRSVDRGATWTEVSVPYSVANKIPVATAAIAVRHAEDPSNASFYLVAQTDYGFGPMLAWTSSDGTAWDPVKLKGLDEGRPNILRAYGDGLILVGETFASSGTQAMELWRSTDGRTWNRTKLASGNHDRYPFPLGMTVLGRRVVIFGSISGQRGHFSFVSEDGAGFKRHDRPGSVKPADEIFSGLVPGGDGFLLCLSDSNLVTSDIWTSSDGVAWRKIYTDTTEGIVDLVLLQPRGVLGFGWAQAASTDGSTWWTLPQVSFGKGAFFASTGLNDGSVIAVGYNADAKASAVVWRGRPSG